MKILVTYFDPFGGEDINAAESVAKQLPASIDGSRVVTAQLPTVYATCEQVCKRLLAVHKPNVLLMLGQAAGRSLPELERIGINWDGSAHPDNAGDVRLGMRIAENGPDGLFSTLPIDEMTEACRENGLPAGISLTAGSFVCNHLLYSMLLHIKENALPVKAAFAHLPATPCQAAARKMASMDPKTSAQILTVMLKTAIDISKAE